ncbi:DedA family protein [Nocardia vaccinii]|uniref:DedA family protein n=1 Tax=Nocardia vaccinii TaxID=1822 RepID=UPI000A79A16B|nr:DedA family protein [Nocardia vaccinii]
MQQLILSYGLIAIFVLMAAESACLPIPSEVTMMLGGALAAGAVSGPHPNLIAVIVAGTAGNVAGSYLAWLIGRYGGRPALHRWGRYVLLRPEEIDRAQDWFVRRGAMSVFWARLLPGIRTFISLPAGIAAMPPLRFGAYTLAGCLPWTGRPWPWPGMPSEPIGTVSNNHCAAPATSSPDWSSWSSRSPGSWLCAADARPPRPGEPSRADHQRFSHPLSGPFTVPSRGRRERLESDLAKFAILVEDLARSSGAAPTDVLASAAKERSWIRPFLLGIPRRPGPSPVWDSARSRGCSVCASRPLPSSGSWGRR